MQCSYEEGSGLLYIEPSEPASPEPLIDQLTRKMSAAFRQARHSDWASGGFHGCYCGAMSSCIDYHLPSGHLTNSLCVHYLAHHRAEVSADELAIIAQFASGHSEPNEDELQGPKMIERRIRDSLPLQLSGERFFTWISWGLDVDQLTRAMQGGVLADPYFRTETRQEADDLMHLLREIPEELLPVVRHAAVQSHGSPESWGATALRLPGWSREAWVDPMLKLLQSEAQATDRMRCMIRRSIAMSFAYLRTAARAALPTLRELMNSSTGDMQYDVSLALKYSEGDEPE